MIVAVLNYHSSITTIMVKSDNILCINYTIKTETVRKQVQNMLKRLLFSSRQAFLLSKTACKAAWDPGLRGRYTRVRKRCRPGSARSPDGDAEKFIRRVGGTFMPCFGIFFADGYFCPNIKSTNQILASVVTIKSHVRATDGILTRSSGECGCCKSGPIDIMSISG